MSTCGDIYTLKAPPSCGDIWAFPSQVHPPAPPIGGGGGGMPRQNFLAIPKRKKAKAAEKIEILEDDEALALILIEWSRQ